MANTTNINKYITGIALSSNTDIFDAPLTKYAYGLCSGTLHKNIGCHKRSEITVHYNFDNPDENTTTLVNKETVDTTNVLLGFTSKSSGVSPKITGVGGMMYKCYPLTEEEKNLFTTYSYTDINTGVVVTPKSYGYYYATMAPTCSNSYILTDVDRKQTYVSVSVSFISLDDDGAPNSVSSSALFSTSADLFEWLENDDTGKITINDTEYYLNIFTMAVDAHDFTSSIPQYAADGSLGFVAPLYERYFDESYHLSTSPFVLNFARLGTYYYSSSKTANYYGGFSNGFVNSGSFISSNSPLCGFNGSLEHGLTEADFNTYSTFADVEDVTYNLNSIDKVATGYYTIRFVTVRDDGYVIYYGSNYYGSYPYTMYLMQGKLTTGKQVLATAASTLIPFCVYNSVLKDECNWYVGVREDDGSVEGRYVQLTSDEQIESQYVPDDFEPVDAEEEYNNSQPLEIDNERKDITGDNIALNNYNISCSANAFCSLWALTGTQVTALGTALWDSMGTLDFLANFFSLKVSDEASYELSLAEVIQYFVNMRYYPLNLTNLSVSQTQPGLYIGTGANIINTGTAPRLVTSTYTTLYGGSVTLPMLYGNYLDFEPCTAVSVFVPYCGTADLVPSVVMGRTLSLHYGVDLATGNVTAYVMVLSSSGSTYSPVAVVKGQIGYDILLTGNNNNSQMTTAVTGAWSTLLGGITNIGSGVLSGLSGGVVGALSGAASGALETYNSVAQGVANAQQTLALTPLTAGQSTDMSGLICPETAFVQIQRKYPVTAGNYNNTVGYPSVTSASLAAVSGWTQVINPDLSGFYCTDEERSEIYNLLQGGVYL